MPTLTAPQWVRHAVSSRDLPHALTRPVRRRTRSPFAVPANAPLLVHCSHHKVGTVWIFGVLRSIAGRYGLRTQRLDQAPVSDRTDILLVEHARRFRTERLGGREFRGTHLIRDPRDVVVSGYFYHLWTHEQWAHLPTMDYDGKSYQQHLRSLSPEEGLLAEIERSAGTVIRDMAAWDYTQPHFLELRYEEMVTAGAAGFERVFRFYGFSDAAVAHGLRVADRHSLQAKAARARGGRPAHVRSGASGQWREHFRAQHVERFKELTGDAVVRLGYESDDRW